MLNINSGDTAWVLFSTALVMLMTPGLAFFYGGMVRKKKYIKYSYAVFYSYVPYKCSVDFIRL